jgi:hypothetical protein
MTPREQLIEAIATKRCQMSELGTTDAHRSGAWDIYVDTADLTLQALSDLGAVVLMPVRSGQSVANVIVLDEKHVLKTTQEERDEGVYINALEGEDES